MSGGDHLVLSNLSAGYRGRPVLESLDAAPIRAGCFTALVGPNGAGKSTLLRALAGLISARGTLRLGALDLIPLSLQERARHVGFMPQSLPSGVGLVVFETLLGALKASPLADGLLASAEAHRRAMETLERLGIAHLMMEPMDRLSGGQRQLVGLAQALVRQPRLLLLDEPTSALDLRHQHEVMQVVKSIADEGRIVIAVMHDLTLAARWADRVMVLGEGHIRGDGTPQEAITPETLAAVYKVRAHVAAGPAGGLQIVVNGPLETFA